MKLEKIVEVRNAISKNEDLPHSAQQSSCLTPAAGSIARRTRQLLGGRATTLVDAQICRTGRS